MRKKNQNKFSKNKKLKYYHPTKKDIKNYIPKEISSPDDQEQPNIKKEKNDGEYLITYTRHLEKRLRNLETEKQLLDAERLRLEQELHNLRNEIDRNRSPRLRNLPIILKIGGFFASVTAKNKERFSEILEKLMLFVLRIRNLDDQRLKDVNSKVSNLFEEIDEFEKKFQEPSQILLKWYELHSIKTEEPQVRNNRKEIEEKKEFDYKFKIIVLGESRKTAFIHQFLTGFFKADLKMTLGVDFSVKSMEINGKKIKLEIWDCGAKERFRFIFPQYIRDANGAIILYDTIDAKTLKTIPEFLEIIKKNVGDIPIFLNVPELPSKAEEIVALTEKYTFTEITSEVGPNGEHAFESLTKKMLEYEYIE